MTDHKFEPGQLVLVRDNANAWKLKHFSHINTYGGPKYATTDSNTWQMCIPFNDDTKHLQNSTLDYEPPKPPQEYEWGDKVEVYERNEWHKALYIDKSRADDVHWCARKDSRYFMSEYHTENIRPLPDTAAQ